MGAGLVEIVEADPAGAGAKAPGPELTKVPGPELTKLPAPAVTGTGAAEAVESPLIRPAPAEGGGGGGGVVPGMYPSWGRVVVTCGIGSHHANLTQEKEF
jgi:hypothetical protein